jgi:hypothetical protein
MTEQPAEGVQGFLLYDPRTKKHFFRVYEQNKQSYQDYELCIEDLRITINAKSASLFKDNVKSFVGWSSKYLKRCPDLDQNRLDIPDGKK